MMRKRWGFLPSLVNLIAVVLVATLLAFAQGQGRGKGKPGGGGGAWEEHFNGPLDKKKWVISSWFAPGYLPGNHQGYYDAENVTIQSGYLILKLWQEPGDVDGNPDGVISHGAHVTTKQKYGYGTYEWRMRMSSTATSPTGAGDPVSGSVSAGFSYVNNSETEIDYEFGAHLPDTLYMVNWYNTDPATGPFDEHVTYTALPLPDVSDAFHTYKFVWEPGRITFYVDDVLQATHTTDVPSAPALFMINHWGTNNPFWGGPATFGVDRYFYIDWARFTPQP
ncbi:MAG TPA: glycoside hydrolase family 16 protein [Candidatus Acidoferrales bacterium]